MKTYKYSFFVLVVAISMIALSHNVSCSEDLVHFTNVHNTQAFSNYAGEVFIDNQKAVDKEDEVGVFVQNNSGEYILIGACIMGVEKNLEGYYFVVVYADDPASPEKDGATEGDLLLFKIWDKSEDKEYQIDQSSMQYIFADLTEPEIPPKWSASKTFGLLNLFASNTGKSPQISFIPDITIKEDEISEPISFTVTDEDSEASTLSITIISDNDVLLPDESMYIGGTEENRILNITPAHNQSGTSTITVNVSDGALTATTQFLLTVEPVNDTPQISAINSVEMKEDTTSEPIAFTVSDIDSDISSLDIQIHSNNFGLLPQGSISLSGEGESKTLIIQPAQDKNGSATITVSASDGYLTATTEFQLTVLAVNDPPVITDISPLTIKEDSLSNPMPFTITDIDTDFSSIIVTVHSSNSELLTPNSIHLSEEDQKRYLTIKPANNKNGSAIITITANDGSLTTTTAFTLTVAKVNDPPLISIVQSLSIDEDTTSNPIPFTVTDVDTDVSSILISVSSNNTDLLPEGAIQMNSDNETQYLTILPASDKYGTANLTISANDGELTSTTTFTLTVNEINDPPVVSGISNQTKKEGESFDMIDLDNFVSDIDNSTDEIQWMITGAESLNISMTTDNRVHISPLSSTWNGKEILTFIATDPQGLTSSQSAAFITLKPVNSNPEISAIDDFSMDEDSKWYDISFTVSDPETSPEFLNISIIADNTNLFSSSGIRLEGTNSHRVIYVQPQKNQNGKSMLSVIVSDGELETTEKFEVTVTPVNDIPVITGIDSASMNEDTTSEPIAFTVSDIDSDVSALDVQVYSNNSELLPKGSISFSGENESKILIIQPAQNKNGTATITVNASDGYLTATAEFQLTVLAVNDPPVIADISPLTIDEDSLSNPMPFNITDIDTNFSSIFVSVHSNNTIMLPDDSIQVGEVNQNRYLTIQPANNMNGSAIVTISAFDGHLTAITSFHLTVNAINDPPEISAINNFSMNEDAQWYEISFTVSDPETSSEFLNISIVAENTGLFSSDGIRTEGIENDRTLYFKPLENQHGKSLITVIVSDGELETIEQFEITVISVNDMPELTVIDPVEIKEDSTSDPIAFTVSDIDSDVSALDVQVSSNNSELLPQGSISLSGENKLKQLIIQPDQDKNGTAMVTVAASDGDLSATIQFQLTVQPENDAPVITEIAPLAIDEDSTSSPIPLIITDIDTDFSSIFVSVHSNNTILLPTDSIQLGEVNQNRYIIIQPAKDTNGSTIVTIAASDGFLTATTSLHLTVNAINDPPETTDDIPDQAKDEGESFDMFDLDDFVRDVDNSLEEIQWMIVGAESLQVSVTSDNHVYISPPNSIWNGQEILTFIATDPQGLTTIQSATFTVKPKNSSPEISTIDNFSMNEDAQWYEIPFTVSDPETSAEYLNISIVAENSELFSTNEIRIQGTKIYIAPKHNQYGKTNMTIMVSDGELETSESFEITVIPVNDPPVTSNTSFEMLANTSLACTLSVHDIDDSTFSFKISKTPEHGTVVILDDRNGSIQYTPDSHFIGQDVFTYLANDGKADSNASYISIVVVDRTAPDLLLRGDTPYYQEVKTPYQDQGATAIDDILGNISHEIVVENTVNSDILGTYTVTYRVTDTSNNTSEKTRTVIVQDTTPPVITLKGDANITIGVHSVYNDNGAIVTDNYDDSRELTFNDAIHNVNTDYIGTYEVVYGAVDMSNNQALEITRVVNVVDTEKPVIHLNGSNLIKHKIDTQYDEKVTATDNYDGDISNQIQISGNVDIHNEGNYKLVYRVSDTSGNISEEIIRYVVVFKNATATPVGYVENDLSIPVENVRVSLAHNTSAYSALTDQSGQYQFIPLLLNQAHFLQFSKVGYYDAYLLFDGKLPLEKVVMFEKDNVNVRLLKGTCLSIGNEMSNVSVRLSSDNFSTFAISDQQGQYSLLYDLNIDSYVLTASIKGYHTFKDEQFMIPQDDHYDISLTKETSIIIQGIPITNAAHSLAKEKNEVSFVVKALPDFSGHPHELSMNPLENNTISSFSDISKSYTITHKAYENFDILINADTTDNNDIKSGYYTSRQLYFTAISGDTTVVSTSEKLAVNKGEPVILKSSNQQSQVMINIPGNGFCGEKIPGYVTVGIHEYDQLHSAIIEGKIVNIEIVDDYGKIIGNENDLDNPLREIFITLGFQSPVTKDKINQGIYTLNHGLSPHDLAVTGGNAISPDDIDHIDDQTITIRSTHLSAFGFALASETPKQTDDDLYIPKPDANCFVRTIRQGNSHIALISTVFLLFVGLIIFYLSSNYLRKKNNMKTVRFLQTCVLAFIVISFPIDSQAQVKATMTPLIGGYIFEGNETIGDGPIYGLSFGLQFSEYLESELKYHYAQFNENYYDKAMGQINKCQTTSNMIFMDVLYNLSSKNQLTPYISAGIGYLDFDTDYVDFDSSLRLNYGGGLKYSLTKNLTFRGEIRHVFSPVEARNNLLFSVGLCFHQALSKPGETVKPSKTKQLDKNIQEPSESVQATLQKAEILPPTDSDHDGIEDAKDLCENTPPGVLVNQDGCPFDKDSDGVYDYQDRCSNTPSNIIVDKNGCPLDQDKDGIYDDQDNCPNTPSQLTVDRNGCPKDNDNDGIFDDFDKCPDTKTVENMDAEGCNFSPARLVVKPDNQGKYPYTIQISSYKDRNVAKKIASIFYAKGDPVYTSPTFIKGKGTWHRIFYGYYGTKEDVSLTMNILKQRHFRHFYMQHLPFAIQVGTLKTERELSEMESKLISKGYIPYRIPDKNGSRKLLVGAFRTSRDAMNMLNMLLKDFRDSKIVLR